VLRLIAYLRLKCGWIAFENRLYSGLLLLREHSIVVTTAAATLLAAHLVGGETHAIQLQALGRLARTATRFLGLWYLRRKVWSSQRRLLSAMRERERKIMMLSMQRRLRILQMLMLRVLLVLRSFRQLLWLIVPVRVW
jgi:hypothetical protein